MRQLLRVMICLCLAPFAAEAQPAFEDFPYPIIAVDRARAFAEWQALRTQPGTPIILGPAAEMAQYDPLEIPTAYWGPWPGEMGPETAIRGRAI